MNRLALIDGDFILWACVPNKVPTETERMYGVSFDKTLQQTLDLVDWYVTEKILKPTQVDSYIGFLGGKGNFRKELTPQYKSKRTDERPNFFKETKQYLVDKYNFHVVDGIEAEDAVGISLNKYPNAVIIREDHDLNQLEGTHFNPTRQEWKTITPKEAKLYQWKQMLTGCASDEIKGIPKVGEVTASKILKDIETWNLAEVVLNEYIKYFGEVKGIEEFYLNYRLLRILREEEVMDIPEPNEVPSVKTEEVNLTDLKF